MDLYEQEQALRVKELQSVIDNNAQVLKNNEQALKNNVLAAELMESEKAAIALRDETNRGLLDYQKFMKAAEEVRQDLIRKSLDQNEQIISALQEIAGVLSRR
jgi:hypothetical protein